MVIRLKADNLGQHVQQLMLVNPHTQHQHVTGAETIALEANRSSAG